MALFKKKDKFVDLTQSPSGISSRNYVPRPTYSKKVESNESPSQDNNLIFPADFNPSSQMNNTSTSNEEYMDISNSVDDRRKKLVKRLMDMTNKIEEMSNKIYHIEQRIEVLERKTGANRFD